MKTITNKNTTMDNNIVDNNIVDNVMGNLLFMKDNTNLGNNYKEFFGVKGDISLFYNDKDNECFIWKLDNNSIEYDNIDKTINIKSNINNLNDTIKEFNKDINLMDEKILENNKILDKIVKIYQKRKEQDRSIEKINLKKEGYIKYDINKQNLYIVFGEGEYNLENILEELKNLNHKK